MKVRGWDLIKVLTLVVEWENLVSERNSNDLVASLNNKCMISMKRITLKGVRKSVIWRLLGLKLAWVNKQCKLILMLTCHFKTSKLWWQWISNKKWVQIVTRLESHDRMILVLCQMKKALNLVLLVILKESSSHRHLKHQDLWLN